MTGYVAPHSGRARAGAVQRSRVHGARAGVARHEQLLRGMTNPALALKAIKSARLAAGEAKLGHDDTAYNQGRIAGELAAGAGLRTDDLAREVPQLDEAVCYPAWNGIVDGWYEAQPKDVTATELDVLQSVIETAVRNDGDRNGALDTVARMWAELQRLRG